MRTGIGSDRREVGLPRAVTVEVGQAQRRHIAVGAVQRCDGGGVTPRRRRRRLPRLFRETGGKIPPRLSVSEGRRRTLLRETGGKVAPRLSICGRRRRTLWPLNWHFLPGRRLLVRRRGGSVPFRRSGGRGRRGEWRGDGVCRSVVVAVDGAVVVFLSSSSSFSGAVSTLTLAVGAHTEGGVPPEAVFVTVQILLKVNR